MGELYTIKVSSKASDLTGIGAEFLMVDGVVLAKFWNGNMVGTANPAGNTACTVTPLLKTNVIWLESKKGENKL